ETARVPPDHCLDRGLRFIWDLDTGVCLQGVSCPQVRLQHGLRVQDHAELRLLTGLNGGIVAFLREAPRCVPCTRQQISIRETEEDSRAGALVAPLGRLLEELPE